MRDVNYIKINDIHLKNFMSFNDVELNELSQYKIIFIMSTNATGKSTLTSEALYYTFFNNSLRFKRNDDLLNNNYINGDAYASVTLNINNHSDINTLLNIRRNLINKDQKFEIETDNDKFDMFIDFKEIKSVDRLNDFIKRLLDLNEQKFNILYLKSPFSNSLFETNSDLLASITKVNYFHELRNDFNSILKDIKNTSNILQSQLNNQNNLLNSTKKQLSLISENEDNHEKNLQLLETIKKELTEYQNKYNIAVDKKSKAIINRNKLQKEIDQYNYSIGQVETEIKTKRNEYSRYQKLIKRGKCPTCEQTISSDLYQQSQDILINDGNILKSSLNDLIAVFTEQKNRMVKINEYIQQQADLEYSLNASIRNLNNQIIQLENKIKSKDDTTKCNTVLLTEINKTITDIEKDISLLEHEYNLLNQIYKALLSKNSKYINDFYNQKIVNFTSLYQNILNQMTYGKYNKVVIDMGNNVIFNNNIKYESLSTSERKIIDISFVISYIAFLSTELKFKTFILDEFLDNMDIDNVIHIYKTIYEIANEFNLQIIITSNTTEYLLAKMGQEMVSRSDILMVDLRALIGMTSQNNNLFNNQVTESS